MNTAQRRRYRKRKKFICNLFKGLNISSININEIISDLNKVQICEFPNECTKKSNYLNDCQKEI